MRHLDSIAKDTPVSTQGSTTTTYKWTTNELSTRKTIPSRWQILSIAPAALICWAGGMKWAWCVFEPQGRRFDATTNENLYLRCMWFVGMFMGAPIATICIRRLQKEIINFLCGLLECTGAMLSIILAQNRYALWVSCLFEGVSYSLAIVLIYVNVSELTAAHKRAFFIINAERSALWLGILLQLLLTQVYYRNNHEQVAIWHATRLHALCILCLGLLSLCISYLQMRAMVVRSRMLIHISSMVKNKLNTFTLLRVLSLRLYATLPLSLCFTGVYLTLSWQAFGTDYNCIYTLAAAGLVGSLVGSWLVDAYGRRSVAVCGALLCSQLIFVSGGVLREVSKSEEIFTHSTFKIVALLLLCYEFLNSLGVGAAASAYATEAFCQQTKPTALGIIIGSEALLQIVLILMRMYLHLNAYVLFLIFGAMGLFIGVCVFIFFPETQARTLGECVHLFYGSTTAF